MMAATLLSVQRDGVEFRVDSDTEAIDPGRSVFLRVELKTPRGTNLDPPDLRERVKGFSLAEDFEEEPKVAADGSVTKVVNWKLVPEPCAEEYKVKPLTVGGFNTEPIRFAPPAVREPVTGGMEVDPKKDLPPLSWRMVGWCLLALSGLALAVAALWFGVRYLLRRVKEHRMSPIERAWVELDRLLKRGLPGRGRYKDFYVELTMVVRRYIQRKYGIRAPHMTTEEFLRAAKPSDELRKFLESADMVKFAGVEATPEMADGATESARGYLRSDDKTMEERK